MSALNISHTSNAFHYISDIYDSGSAIGGLSEITIMLTKRAKLITDIVTKYHIPVNNNREVFHIDSLGDINVLQNNLFAGRDTQGFLAINIPLSINIIADSITNIYNGIIIIFQNHYNKKDLFIISDNKGIDTFKHGIFRDLRIIEQLLSGIWLQTRSDTRKAIIVRLSNNMAVT